MSFDFTPTGWRAVYVDRSGGRTVDPVVAWDDDGFALVVDQTAGRLVRPSIHHGFAGIESTECGRVAAVMPAGPGWNLRVWEGRSEEGESWVTPIAAWIVDEDGYAHPVSGSSDDTLTVATNQRTEIIPPPATYSPDQRSHLVSIPRAKDGGSGG